MTRLVDALIEYEPVYVAPLGVIPLISAGFLPRQITWLAVIVAAVPWVLRWVKYRRLSVNTPLDIPWAGFLVGSIIGLYPSVDPQLSIDQLWGIVGGIFLFYMLVNTYGGRFGPIYTLASLALFPLVAWWGLWNTPLEAFDKTRLTWVVGALREAVPTGSYNAINPNGLAGLLIIMLPVAGCLAFSPYRGAKGESMVSHGSKAFGGGLKLGLLGQIRGLRAFCLIDFFVMLGLLAMSGSRASILAFLVSVIVCLVLLNKWFLTLIPLVFVAGYEFVTRFVIAPEKLLDTTNGIGRIELWQSAYYMIQDFAYTGIGLGAFVYVYPFYAITPVQANVFYVHNMYLQVYLDQGLLGFSSWIVILAVLGILLWRLIRGTRRGTFEHALSIGLAGTLAAFGVQGIFEASLSWLIRDASGAFHMLTSPVPYFLAGWICSLKIQQDKVGNN